MRQTLMGCVIGAILLSGAAWAGEAGDAKAKAEAAVAKAVMFLKKSQRDGKWGIDMKDKGFLPNLGITSLCAYALAAAPGEKDADTKAILDKAVQWILSFQKKDGSIFDEKEGLQNYNTSIAIMALNAIDKAKYKDAIKQGQDYIAGIQCGEKTGYEPKDKFYGGIGYGSTLRPDLSNLQIALDALKETGVDDPEIYKRAVTFLQRCQNRSESNDQPNAGNDGGFFYSPDESKAGEEDMGGRKGLRSYASMTYAGFKSMLYAGLAKDDPRVKASLEWIQSHYSMDENPGMGKQGLFYYYHTMARAMAAYGAKEIKDAEGQKRLWAADLAGKLAATQAADGSWTNEADRWFEGGTALPTAYSLRALTLCLQNM